MDAASERAATIEIAREAGDLLRSYFGTDRVHTKSKGDRDVVTAADLASEQLVRRRLEERFPGDGIVAEEGTRLSAQTGRFWCVDPLDGTLNYSRGIPLWCVSLALFQSDRPILGVVHDPLRNETFSATQAQGAWCNEDQIRCSEVSDLSAAVVHLTADFNDAKMLVGAEDFALVAPRVLRVRNSGSASLALAYVAAGRFDAMIHRFAHAWDYAAGVIIILEAGGMVTDMAGRPYTAETSALLAAAGTGLHTGLLDLFRAPRPASLE